MMSVLQILELCSLCRRDQRLLGKQELYLFSSIMFFWVSAKTLTMSWGICTSGILLPFEVFPANCARHICGKSASHSSFRERRKAADLQKGAVRKGFVPAALIMPQGSPLDRSNKTSTAVPLQRRCGPLCNLPSTPKSPHVNAAHP